MKYRNMIILLTVLGLIPLFIVFIFSVQTNEVRSNQDLELNVAYHNPEMEPKKNSAERGIVTNIWISDERKLERMRENGIKYLIVDVGDIRANGELVVELSEIIRFTNFISDYEKKTNHDFILMPYSEIITLEIDFTDSQFQENFIMDFLSLILLGFDGVYVDFEPIDFKDRGNFLVFLDRLKKEFGDSLVGVYGGHVANDPGNYWVWSEEFYRFVTEKVDFVVVPGYDSDSMTKDDYENYLGGELEVMENGGWGGDVFIGLPTHKEYPETIENALGVYSDFIDGNRVGFIVFAEWTMDEGEWSTVKKYIN